LAKYYGIANRLVLAEPEIGQGVSELALVKTYNTFDIMLTTTQGEGFGLPTFEGMACGIPQIVPKWAALEELCEDAAIKVPCTSIACTPNKINVIGGIADRNETIEAMDSLYNSIELRKEYSKKGLELVSNPRYRWENIGQKFAEAMEEALYPEMLKDSK
jgi:glycosyltransferase involved in cell wall biosynthesis